MSFIDRSVFRATSFSAILFSAILLGACGGGGGGTTGGGGGDTNSTPAANAGTDQTLSLGAVVSLSGAGSSDANGDSLTYSWSIVSTPVGSLASLNDAATVSPQITLDLVGDYIISLVVNDGTIDSTTDQVTLTAVEFVGNITTGVGTTITANLFPSGVRIAPLGTIQDGDDQTWAVPADVNYDDASFPFASDLSNPYGTENANETAALLNLNPADIVEIDAGGELITGYIYADNYFELYVNGIAVGKDPVPFTDFNSSLVQFRVSTPFTVAMLLVDWEESLGTGTETNGGAERAGDAGVVAVFKNEADEIIGITDSSWKAQTFYTAPITDLGCLSEEGSQRLSEGCSTADLNDLTSVNGIHWEVDADWATESFDDSDWPSATTYTNDAVGVNRPQYTNFTNVFDDPAADAQFIWSTNLVLDNEVIVRKLIEP